VLERGREIDRYRVEHELGSGGMATVYRVRHVRLGSVHALKVLKVGGRDLQERLVQEGRVQAQLRHPHIVAVTDVVDVDGAPGLVMDLVAGPPLDAWLREHRPGLGEALRLFDGIVSGVARAHREGLVHRDLKPGNVLLEEGDTGLVAKVTDFGLAKILADTGSSLTRTRSGVSVGTPQYMAPEQVRDASRVDQRADVFALGCILYELACGRSPFQQPDVLSTMNAVVAGDYAPPESLAPALPERVRAAIAGSLQVDRDKRIPDCATLLAVLSGESTRSGERRAARAGAAAPSTASWAALALGGGALVALTGAGVLALALGAWWWSGRAPADEPVASAEPVEVPAAPVTAASAAPAVEVAPAPKKRAHHQKRPAPKAAAVVPATPAPATPAPAPESPAPVAEAPAPAPARTASVFVLDDQPDELWLVDAADRRHAVAGVPEGAYTLWYRFGEDEIPLRGLRLSADRPAHVKCSARQKRCVRAD
jgi:serine/threonine-protein kinase